MQRGKVDQIGHFQLIPIEAKLHAVEVNCGIDNGSEKAHSFHKTLISYRVSFNHRQMFQVTQACMRTSVAVALPLCMGMKTSR